MSFNTVRNELLAIFPQHNEEAITRVYNTVVGDIGESTEVLVLPACIEQLLILPASKNGHKDMSANGFGGNELSFFNIPQNKTNKTVKEFIFPKRQDSDSSEDDSDSTSSHDEARRVHEDYRNKPRPTYRERRERSASKSDDDSLLGYLSDKDDSLFSAEALMNDLDNIEPSKLLYSSNNTNTVLREPSKLLYNGNNANNAIRVPDSPLLHLNRKRKLDDKILDGNTVNMVTEQEVNTIGPIVKKIHINTSVNKPIANEEPDLSAIMKGMPGYFNIAKENIKAIISDVDNAYLDNLINAQEQVSIPVVTQRIVDHLLNFRDYPKVPKILPPCLQKSTSASGSTFHSTSTITSSEETVKYNQQAIKLLQNAFPKISTTVIRKTFYRFNKYTTAFIELEKALASVVSGEKVVENTILKSLLKGKRTKIRVLDMSSLLAAEMQQMEDSRKKDLEKGDLATAVALNTKEYEEEGQTIECGCCYNEVAFEDMVQCIDGHLFCSTCLQNYSKEATYGTGNLQLSCMTDGCGSTFPLSQLKKALPEELMNKYMERVQDEDIKLANLDNLIRCPGCDFAAEMDDGDKVFRCQNPSCMKESCRYCKEDWMDHFGVPCKELEKKEATSLRTGYEERMTQAKVRKCWQCSTIFLKSDGCNKMTCRCGAKMCYICRGPKIDYSHFCNHPRNPGEGCTKCKKCSLWTDPSEDDDRAVAEIKKEAEEERMKLASLEGEEQTSKISIGPQITIQPSTTKGKQNPNIRLPIPGIPQGFVHQAPPHGFPAIRVRLPNNPYIRPFL